MVSSATLHTSMAEVVVGSMVLATICAVGCLASRALAPSKINNESLFITMDRASLAGSFLALVFLPIAIMTGNLAAESHSSSALLYNKFVYSGLALGFWCLCNRKNKIGRGIMGGETISDTPIRDSLPGISDDNYLRLHRRKAFQRRISSRSSSIFASFRFRINTSTVGIIDPPFVGDNIYNCSFQTYTSESPYYRLISRDLDKNILQSLRKAIGVQTFSQYTLPTIFRPL